MDQHSDSNAFAEAFEASLNFKKPEQGEILRGTVVSVSGDDVFVTYGGPTEAVISVQEVPDIRIGETIEATVVQTNPDIRLSRKFMARKASADALRRAFESRIPVEGKVAARNKGGFDVNVSGLRAFCPLSQIGLGKIETPEAFIGQSLEFRITEISDDGRRIVVSRAALLKEEAAERTAEVRKAIEPGAVVRGTVRRLVPFGAFVDLGGNIEGLLHVSEISRRRVNDPKEVLTPGQEVDVKILKIDEAGKRISLSMKELEADPWQGIAERYAPGSRFTGTIARGTDFGLFVELEPGIDGLVHVSQLPPGMKLTDEALKPGTVIDGWIREVDPQKKRISLAMREVATSDPWEEAEKKYAAGTIVEGTVERAGGPGVFVQLEPGLTGLIPNSELGLPPGSDASKTHKPGDKVTVSVLTIDRQRKRVALSTEAAKAAAVRADYVNYKEQRDSEAAQGKTALALAFEKALDKKNP